MFFSRVFRIFRKGGDSLFFGKRIREECNRERVKELSEKLIEKGTRGYELGIEVRRQYRRKYLSWDTYARLSRWVNPKRSEPFAHPIAAEISIELFGEKIQRVQE